MADSRCSCGQFECDPCRERRADKAQEIRDRVRKRKAQAMAAASPRPGKVSVGKGLRDEYRSTPRGWSDW